MIHMAFRFDDPSPVSKRHVEEHLFEDLFSREIPLTCAVIPARLRDGKEIRFTPERAGHFQRGLSSSLLEVALHGYLHREARQAPSGRPSEFSEVPAIRQKALIESGRALLEDVFQRHLIGFVPPWNSFDGGTLGVLEETGFTYVSADLRTPARVSSTLRILPLTCGLSQLEDAIVVARRFERFAPVIIVVMHHYDFDRDDDDPPCTVFSRVEFAALLDRIRLLPQLQFVTLGGLADSLSVQSSRLWIRQQRLQDLLPHRFKHFLPESCILTRALPAWKR